MSNKERERKEGKKRLKKTKRQKERACHFNLHPCGYLLRHQPVHFYKGQVKEGAPCPLSTGVIKLRNQPVVRHLWDSHLCIRQSIENCCLHPFPRGLLLAAGKYR